MQALLSNMVYADDDESLLEAEVSCHTWFVYLNNYDHQLVRFMMLSSMYSLLQEDGSLPDREQVKSLFFFVDFGGFNWKITVFHYLVVLLMNYVLFTITYFIITIILPNFLHCRI